MNKPFLVFVVSMVATICLTMAWCTRTKAADLPMRIERVDLEILKRTESQLQTLQLRYQAEAAPIIKEHDELVAKWCTSAKLTGGPSGDCQLDLNGGLVTKKATATGTPAK